jgi:predicted short-subunit dehydrogenase-like oxidoreductase (DUF2520 family)
MLDVVLIGGGAVAEGLAREIDAAEGLRLVQRWTRKTNVSPSPGLATVSTSPEIVAADLYILAVSDSAVADVSTQFAFPTQSVVAHTAGSVPIDALSPKIAHRAVLYPLQTFTRGRRIDDFRRRVPFFIEGTTSHALETVRTVAEAISDNVSEMSSPERARLHLAAVFAGNFSNAMFSVAEKIANDAGVPYDLLRPLIAETAAKALAMPSPRDAQTGPAARGDLDTQRQHIEILRANHPEITETYKNISEIIWRISKKN